MLIRSRSHSTIDLYESTPLLEHRATISTTTVQASDGGWIYADVQIAPLSAEDKSTLIDCITADAHLFDAVLNTRNATTAKDLTYLLAMEADLYVIPKEWSAVASAWCRCSGTLTRSSHTGQWCEHAAAIMCELACACNDDPFFVYQMRGVHLAPRLQRSARYQRSVVDLASPTSPMPALPQHRAGGCSLEPIELDSD